MPTASKGLAVLPQLMMAEARSKPRRGMMYTDEPMTDYAIHVQANAAGYEAWKKALRECRGDAHAKQCYAMAYAGVYARARKERMAA